MKHRDERPLAVLFPSLEAVKAVCEVTSLEESLLRSPEGPVVLLGGRSAAAAIAPSVAPRNPMLGVLLPYSGLHHLLLQELGTPVAVTSGSAGDDPICIDEEEALERLAGIADLFLVHDRPILRPVDDSIVRIMRGRPLVLRRGRGYAPMAVPLARKIPAVLAVGAQIRSAVAVSAGQQAVLSQQIGDMETEQAFRAFRQLAVDLPRMYELRPRVIAADGHPDYLSTLFAYRTRLTVIGVQHHIAHVLSCMLENELAPPVLGVAFDRTGYGSDGTMWGGEFLRVEEKQIERVAHLRTFPLPDGAAGGKEPRQSALAVLYECFGEECLTMENLPPIRAFARDERAGIAAALRRDDQAAESPRMTSTAGRLFDAVASIIGLRQISRFEGQAAMELEFAAEGSETQESYPFGAGESLDWEPMIRAVLRDLSAGVGQAEIAAKFHNTLADMIVSAARAAGESCVALSGGCFQNCRLTDRTVERLEAAGFKPHWHQRVPPNDGGIALGQIAAAQRALQR